MSRVAFDGKPFHRISFFSLEMMSIAISTLMASYTRRLAPAGNAVSRGAGAAAVGRRPRGETAPNVLLLVHLATHLRLRALLLHELGHQLVGHLVVSRLLLLLDLLAHLGGRTQERTA